MTKKQVKIVKFILGKEEVGGSNPLVGSFNNQGVTKYIGLLFFIIWRLYGGFYLF